VSKSVAFEDEAAAADVGAANELISFFAIRVRTECKRNSSAVNVRAV
jgi:hypothetical protein